MPDGLPSRRQLLRTVGVGLAGGFAGCAGGGGRPEPGTDTDVATSSTGAADSPTRTEPTPSAEPPTSFVERDGTHLVVDGQRYVFSGVANCCLAEGYTSTARVRSVLSSAARLGADVVRFKIGSAGGRSDCGSSVDGCQLSFQPRPGEFDETAFRHLDYIVSEAGKRGMRVILPLVDNWGPRGMERYVRWSDTASTHDDFYTDHGAQERYRAFVERLITRENTVTGREYRSDPTVLLWELANEPRVDSDYDALRTWVREIAGLIHELDDNHLVSTGSDVYPEDEYVAVHSVEGIDACSIHLWPQNWGRSDEAGPFGTSYIDNRGRLGSEEVGLPVYLGEYGWRVNLQADDVDAQIGRRNELFAEWHGAAQEADLDGAIAWELLSDGRLEHHRSEPGQGETVGFACPAHEETCSELRSFARSTDARSPVG